MNTKQHINQRLTEIKTNLANWEKRFGVRVYDQHECAASGERDDTAILYVSSPDTDLKSDWAMARIWLAGAEEVRNGDASAVGDSMNLSLIAINYCPFCGQKLESVNNTT